MGTLPKLTFIPSGLHGNGVITPADEDAAEYFTIIGGGSDEWQNRVGAALAAAPDMVEALQWLLDGRAGSRRYAREVIAKAIGSSCLHASAHGSER